MMRLVIILIVLLLISFGVINSQSQGRNHLPLLTKLGQRINDVNQGDAGCIALNRTF